MSRRRRVEDQRALELNEEAEEEDQMKMQMDRVFASLVWLRLPNGIRMQDMKEQYYEEVLQMFRDYYIQEDVLCRNSDLELDEVSTQSFLNQCLYNMKDKSSIIAIHEYIIETIKKESDDEDEEEDSVVVDEEVEKREGEEEEVEKKKTVPKVKNKKKKSKWAKEEPPEIIQITMEDLVGCCIMKVVTKRDYGRVFGRVRMTEGEAHKKCVAIKNNLNRKVDIFAKFNCEVYLEYFAICIKPNYRKQGLGLRFLRCGLDSARAMNIPVVMGVFPNFKLQRLAKMIGLQVVQEISYVNWRDQEGEFIFDDPGPGNYTCNIMAGLVPPPPPPEPPPPPPVDKKGNIIKMTRSEKRAAKLK